MKGSQIRVGGIYMAKVSGIVRAVRVDSVRAGLGNGDRCAWHCTNLDTDRKIIVKSAQRFRSEVSPPVSKREADFDETDCGGAFDGRTVTSDADPGL